MSEIDDKKMDETEKKDEATVEVESDSKVLGPKFSGGCFSYLQGWIPVGPSFADGLWDHGVEFVVDCWSLPD